jgi:hypothetical protein
VIVRARVLVPRNPGVTITLHYITLHYYYYYYYYYTILLYTTKYYYIILTILY